MPPRSVVTAFLLLLGCNHTEPFSTPDNGTPSPFNPTPPVRLTLNRGADRAAAWLADGSGILYSAQQLDRQDRDQCLALLPPTGGRQRSLWCDVLTGADQTDAFLSMAAAPDGRLAFLGGFSTVGGLHPEVLGLRVAPTLDPAAATIVRHIPFNGFLGQLRWLDAARLVYLDQRVRYRTLCNGCPLDTLVANVGIEVLAATGNAAPATVPGTALATGVAPIGEGDEILYTLLGDTRLYRRSISGGTETVVRDFGVEGIARDVHAAGARAVVVVGGVVGVVSDAELGPMQWDSGGVIHVLDLDTGSDTPLESVNLLFRRPALSPAGDRIVAEGYAVTNVEITDPETDSVFTVPTVSGHSDLFLLSAP